MCHVPGKLPGARGPLLLPAVPAVDLAALDEEVTLLKKLTVSDGLSPSLLAGTDLCRPHVILPVRGLNALRDLLLALQRVVLVRTLARHLVDWLID